MEDMNQISQAIVDGKLELAQELVGKAIESGMDAQSIIDDYLTAGMAEIGQRFQDRKAFVPNLLMSARAMKGALEVLKPHMSGRVESHVGTVVIGTVKGDLHDIGKNLVKMMMESKGLEVIDLGTDVSPETFVQTAIEKDCRVIGCSALLTTTMGVMADVVKAVDAAGLRGKVKVMIGGAPVTQSFCDQIGADAYSADAATAADVALRF
ncbi:corrinoid protein, partial [Alistipes finegoldii]|uniref:corrinoid protein n=1 Tax=Alistipes finegoldii TaxID=214856 RepID=UPI003AB8A6C0